MGERNAKEKSEALKSKVPSKTNGPLKASKKLKTSKKPQIPAPPKALICKKSKASKKGKTPAPKPKTKLDIDKKIKVSEKKLQRFMDKAQKVYAEYGEDSPKLAKLVTLIKTTEKAVAKWKQYKTRRGTCTVPNELL